MRSPAARPLRLPRVDHQQRCPGGDLYVLADQHLAHRAGELGHEGGLHLHRLDDGEAVAGLHLVAGLNQQGDDDRGRGGPDDATFVVGDAVGEPVDLDEMGGAVDDGQDAIGVAGDR